MPIIIGVNCKKYMPIIIGIYVTKIDIINI